MSVKESDIIICGHGSGTPRTINLATYNTNRYNQIADNKKRKQIIAVRRLKAMTDTGRKSFHDSYNTILGRNLYDQNRRLYCYKLYKDGKYYSDCSSSICLTYTKIGYSVSALNTAGIYTSDLFEDVPINIVNGHITNPEILKVGDCLLYVGNDPQRPLQIGHVEAVYEIKNSTADSKTEPTMSFTQVAIKSVGKKGIQVMVDVNVREYPSTSSKVIGTVSPGKSYFPTVRTVVNNVGWFKINGGWVSGKYCYGWIQDSNTEWWYLKKVQAYAWFEKCVEWIDEKLYAFNEKGYVIKSTDINSDCSINQ